LSKVYPPHSAQLDQLTQVLADKIDAELYDVLGRRSRVVLRRKPLACRHCAISCGRRWLNSNAPGSWCARKTRVSRAREVGQIYEVRELLQREAAPRIPLPAPAW